MGSLSLLQRYEAIIVPAGSILLIERREESLGTLQRFREHLLPGGRLFLDLELQTDFRVGTISTGTVETPQGETITTESKVVEVNFLEQYSVSHLRYEKWRDGEIVQTEMQRFALRWYGLEEFELVLKSSVGGTLRLLQGNDTRAEVLIAEWPRDEDLSELSLTQSDSEPLWNIFLPIMEYSGIHYAWQRHDDAVMMTFERESTE
jgi:hypothetical protein